MPLLVLPARLALLMRCFGVLVPLVCYLPLLGCRVQVLPEAYQPIVSHLRLQFWEFLFPERRGSARCSPVLTVLAPLGR